MSYANEDYVGKQGYGNDSEPDEIEALQDKYGLGKTRNDKQAEAATSAKKQAKADQAKAGKEVTEESKDAASARNYNDGWNILKLAAAKDEQDNRREQTSRKLIESIDKDKVAVDNKFKSGESKLDRDKLIDEFSQNRYQAKANQAQDRANLEYSTAQGLAKDKQGQDAELARIRSSGDVASALADKTNNANLNLANITATTERSGQTSAVDRARLAANAQVKAALYAPRSYQGY
jgi:hypothetical protein